MASSSAITIRDIAVHLGVTHSTVSRALSPEQGRRHMSVETRNRIVQAAKDLGYRPNGVARNLVRGRTHSIGVIVRHFNDPFYSNMIQELHVRFAQCGYLGVFLSARNMEEFQHAVDSLVTRRVEGVISVALTQEERDRIRNIEVPIVYYGVDSGRANWVGPDPIRGAVLAVTHLVDAGHRKIGFIGRADKQSLRYQGFRRALRARGLSCPDAWVRKPDGMHIAPSVSGIMGNGCEQMLRLLALKDRPTAVICQNDVTALGAERAVLASGLRVPEDMALVGFDGLSEGEYAAVPLTTVDPHMDRIVDLLTETLLQRIEGRRSGAEPVRIRIEPSLVVRESTRGRREEAACDGGLLSREGGSVA